jgi:hypothetical protein
MGTIAEYQSEFEVLINRVTGISENLLKSMYISGLKPALQCTLVRSNPTTLGEAFSLARLMEARFEEERSSSSSNKASSSNFKDDEDDNTDPANEAEHEKLMGDNQIKTLKSVDDVHENTNDTTEKFKEGQTKEKATKQQVYLLSSYRQLWKQSFVSHIITISWWFKEESMFIQRIWDPGIMIFAATP